MRDKPGHAGAFPHALPLSLVAVNGFCEILRGGKKVHPLLQCTGLPRAGLVILGLWRREALCPLGDPDTWEQVLLQ